MTGFLSGKYILKQGVTSITLANNTELVTDVTIPAEKRWAVTNIKIVNPDDVARNPTTIVIFKELAKTNVVKNLIAVNLGAGALYNFPNSTINQTQNLTGLAVIIYLQAGNTITLTYPAGGASTGGTDADGLVIEYFEASV